MEADRPTLRCHVLPEDLVAYTMWHTDNSAAIRQTRFQAILLNALIFAFTAVAAFLLKMHALAIGVLIVGAVITIAQPFYARHRLKAVMGQSVTEGAGRFGLGPTTITFDDEFISDHTAYGRMQVYLRVVERIASTNAHSFVTFGGHAFVIPHERVIEGDRVSFIARLQAAIDHAKASATAPLAAPHARQRG